MRVVVFGATGMVGQGVLRECLLADDVESVLVVGRTGTGLRHPKLREIIHRDFTDFAPIADELAGLDACFYCLGVSAAGLNEADYTRVTYDYTLAAARTLAATSPGLTFVYVSGAGTDSSERGRARWARVKGRTENAVLALLPNGYAFRPGFIQPMHGAVSKTGWYRVLYRMTTPLYPVLRRLFPGQVTTTELVGRAMLRVAREGSPRRVLESRDLG
ncbi:NAD-dependent epimerase/dehydratase family protein [Micromonospora sp. IBHARD004]|uniref:NAD-dependent epimerase/dehydratase family protein n=1 Tax=Micromonospora sp. IBHARD004 TaxID=3457764 RepID=UPI00405971D3